MRIVFISDTHGKHAHLNIPDGDVLVHCGDMTLGGSIKELRSVDVWMKGLPHAHKLVIAGNHDAALQNAPDAALSALESVTYLQDEAAVIDGVKFYGSPWTPEFCNWSFMLPRESARMRKTWEGVPPDTDVLITHGPPFGILDRCPDFRTGVDISVGCELLAERVKQIRPRVHAFGHIHEGYGGRESGGVRYVNAAICTSRLRPTNAPVVVDL